MARATPKPNFHRPKPWRDELLRAGIHYRDVAKRAKVSYSMVCKVIDGTRKSSIVMAAIRDLLLGKVAT